MSKSRTSFDVFFESEEGEQWFVTALYEGGDPDSYGDWWVMGASCGGNEVETDQVPREVLHGIAEDVLTQGEERLADIDYQFGDNDPEGDYGFDPFDAEGFDGLDFFEDDILW